MKGFNDGGLIIMVFNYPNACNYRHSAQNIPNWILPDNGEIKRPDFSGLLGWYPISPNYALVAVQEKEPDGVEIHLLNKDNPLRLFAYPNINFGAGTAVIQVHLTSIVGKGGLISLLAINSNAASLLRSILRKSKGFSYGKAWINHSLFCMSAQRQRCYFLFRIPPHNIFGFVSLR